MRGGSFDSGSSTDSSPLRKRETASTRRGTLLRTPGHSRPMRDDTTVDAERAESNERIPWHTPVVDGTNGDGAAVRLPPPLVYLLAVIGGALLHAFVLPLPFGFAFGARVGAAVAVAILGLGLMAGAIGLFRRTGQDPKPWKATPEVISDGVYRFTRNPMYVGMALLQAGIGIGLANAWIVALVPPVLFIVYATAIRPEEAYLERKFGERYSAYKNSVRRWL